MSKLVDTDIRFLWLLLTELILIVCACWLVFVSGKVIEGLLIFILIELREISYKIKPHLEEK
jgi:hypothetical protein